MDVTNRGDAKRFTPDKLRCCTVLAGNPPGNGFHPFKPSGLVHFLSDVHPAIAGVLEALGQALVCALALSYLTLHRLHFGTSAAEANDFVIGFHNTILYKSHVAYLWACVHRRKAPTPNTLIASNDSGF